MATEWKEVKIGELGEVVGGATPSTKNEDFYGGDIAWITPKDLSNYNERYITRGERNITELGKQSCSTRLLPKNSILFSSRAPIGYIAIARNEMCTNQGFKSIIANADTDYLFLFYLLKFNKDKIEAMGSGTTFKEVSTKVMQSIKLKVPCKQTQQKIAKILSSLDEKIELNNKINENLHAQAQAIFKSWFVNFEPFKNEKYSDSVLGKIPSKFTVVNLESLCSVITKGTTPTTIKRNFMPCGVNFLKVETILENHDFDKTKFTFIDNETNELMSRSKIKENDILLSMAGTIGRFAIVRNDLLPANINQALAIIRADETKISSYCLYSYFLGGWHTNFYLKKIQQAVQANLSLTSIKSLPILLPNREILQAYEKVIIPIIEKIKNIQVENIKLAQIRDTLLPKLMSGELEV